MQKASPTKDTGAGCICVTQNPSGELLILLGEERAYRRRAKTQWSYFGGRKEMDEDLAACAAREFIEESIGVVPLSSEGETLDIDAVMREIEEKSLGRIEHVVRGRGSFCRNLVYVLQIPYSACLERRFQAQRRQLLRLKDALDRHQQLKKQLQYLPAFCAPGTKTCDTCTTVSLDTDERDGSWRVKLWDSELKELFEVKLCITAEQTEEAHGINETWKNALQVLRSLPGPLRSHPAISVQELNGWVTDVSVNHVFLEKLSIAWWSVTEIHKNSDRVKPYFNFLLPHAIEIACAPAGKKPFKLLDEGASVS